MNDLWLMSIIYIVGIILMTPIMIMSLISWRYPMWLSIMTGFVMATIWPWMGFLLLIGYPMFDEEYLKERKKVKKSHE